MMSDRPQQLFFFIAASQALTKLNQQAEPHRT
jgi:hypothetical protein